MRLVLLDIEKSRKRFFRRQTKHSRRHKAGKHGRQHMKILYFLFVLYRRKKYHLFICYLFAAVAVALGTALAVRRAAALFTLALGARAFGLFLALRLCVAFAFAFVAFRAVGACTLTFTFAHDVGFRLLIVCSIFVFSIVQYFKGSKNIL